MSGERPEERWLPTHTVASIMLSVMSMLGDPNYSSPANVDASVEMRNNPERFLEKTKRLVDKANTYVVDDERSRRWRGSNLAR
jgi:ubiquitin-protein ligase